MFPALKKTLIPLVLLALLAGAGVALQPPRAEANIAGNGNDEGVWFLNDYGINGSDQCRDGDLRQVRVFDQTDPSLFIEHLTPDYSIPIPNKPDQDPIIQIGVDDDLIMCVQPANGPDSNVIFNTNGPGDWTDAACGDNGGGGVYVQDVADDCIAEEGEGSGNLTVVATNGVFNNDMDILAIRFTCNNSSVQRITINQEDRSDKITFLIMCKGLANSMSLSATPATVEASPALYSTSHSLVRAIITDASGNPVLPGTKVSVSSTGCGISNVEVDTLDERAEALDNLGTGTTESGLGLTTINGEFGEPPLTNFLDLITFSDRSIPLPDLSASTLEVDTNEPPDGVPNHSEVLVIFHGEACAPGVYTVTFRINNPSPVADVTASVDITVVGPPAFITVTAAPTELICGEKSEITVTATDINNHHVSDNTRIEVLTNWGGVFGGTGTSLTTDQPVNPLSSTTVEIFDGSGIAYLLTSQSHQGPYEVLAASTQPQFGGGLEDAPRVVSQVTVNCTLGDAAPIIPPDTGTGTIRPPNTGDAGLVAGGVDSGTLFAIAGATFIALAAIVRRRFGPN
jgi:hypothetical protein